METHSDSQVGKIMLKLITRNSAEDLYIHRYPSLVIGCMCACVVLQRGEISSPKQAKKKGCQEISGVLPPLAQKELPNLRLQVKRWTCPGKIQGHGGIDEMHACGV